MATLKKYKIKNTSIMHNQTPHAPGNIIELPEDKAEKLADFLVKVDDKTPVTNPVKEIKTDEVASGGEKNTPPTPLKPQTPAKSTKTTKTATPPKVTKAAEPDGDKDANKIPAGEGEKDLDNENGGKDDKTV